MADPSSYSPTVSSATFACWDSGFHCWGIQGVGGIFAGGVGGIFAGVRLPRLTHQPTATAGRWQKEKVRRDQARCALLTGAPHSHAPRR